MTGISNAPAKSSASHPVWSGRRLVAGLVLVLLALGCLALWTAVPVATLYLLGTATDASVVHLMVGLVGVPVAMALWGSLLAWLNGLYLRVSGILAVLEAEHKETGWHRRVSGPLEPMLIVSFALCVAAFLIWFFVYAENPGAFVL